MIHYKQASSKVELEQILELQGQNLPENLSAEEIRTQGFVTVEHDFELLEQMNNACAHTLAVANQKVVGYALSMHPQFGEDIEILKPMFSKINEVFSGESFLVMGQICIAKNYRGQGVFRGLYKHMKQFTQPKFDAIITEVDAKNDRSMNAHKAIGFQELKRYKADATEWSLIYLK